MPYPSAPNRGEAYLVESKDLLLSICDYNSPARVPGEYQRAFEASKADPHDVGPLPERLMRFEESGDLLVWPIIFDGIYKIEVRLSADLHDVDFGGPLARSFFSKSHSVRRLRCPTGRLVLASPYSLGSHTVGPIISVAAGTYQVGLDWNLVEEQKHWFLQHSSDYPRDDGPDGVLYLKTSPASS